MSTLNRRDLCIALSSFAALAAVSASADGQAVERGLPEVMAVPPAPGSKGDPILATPHGFVFADLPVVKNANGETRAVTRGVLPTGEAIELHETTLLPGHMPHPPHKHLHSEFMMIREGTVEFDDDGKLVRLGPGGVVFAASNVMHGLKNVGESNANYFVIAIGRESA